MTDAARRIREIEGRIEGGIFLSMDVEIDFGGDDEAFGPLEYEGASSLYVIRRKRRVN